VKTYIEAVEVVKEEGEEPDFIRIDLDDMSEEEAITLIKSLMTPPYIIQKHYCCHDEDPKKSCRVEVLEVVEK